jgi:TPP-dependent pyruvate/acetoin dehydrogenase alpha subunit
MITERPITKDNTVLKLNLDLYKKLYLIRQAEQKIREHYSEDEMKTPMHMSMGGEAIAVGVCQALCQQDQVFTTYRSHSLYLAKTQNVDNFFAEMYGKATAVLKGKGGSMHLCDPEQGFMGTSAIVASAIPVAVGAAFANKRMDNGKIVGVFFGDGALEEGAFWESINVASLMQLPVLFVCEDNELAVHTTKKHRQGFDSITDIINRYRCDVFASETTDAEEIFKLACKAVNSINATSRPCFIHLKYYRYLEHVGVEEDFDAGYRTREEFRSWYEKDPINLQRAKLVRLGAGEDELLMLEAKINNQIDNSIKLAKQAPLADVGELYKDVVL